MGCSEAPPATMLLSNSLYLDVVPQMMAGIIMNWIMLDDADLAKTVDREDPTGVSFFLSGNLRKGEHLPCVALVVLSGTSTWCGLVDPVHSWGGHWAPEIVKTNT